MNRGRAYQRSRMPARKDSATQKIDLHALLSCADYEKEEVLSLMTVSLPFVDSSLRIDGRAKFRDHAHFRQQSFNLVIGPSEIDRMQLLVQPCDLLIAQIARGEVEGDAAFEYTGGLAARPSARRSRLFCLSAKAVCIWIRAHSERTL